MSGNFVSQLPEGVPCSEDIKKRALCYMKVKLFGKPYYVPITRNAKKLFGIKQEKGEFTYPYGNHLEDILQDVIYGVHLQIRDTVGSQIYDNLSSELKEGLEKMFSPKLTAAIERKLEENLLPSPSGEEEKT